MLKLFIGLFVLSGSLLIINAADNQELSLPYTTESICDTKKELNDTKFPDFIRSNCFVKSSKFYYYICSKGAASCGSQAQSGNTNQTSGVNVGDEASGENPYKNLLSKSLLSKVGPVVLKLNKITLTQAKTTLTKLERVSVKYKSNKTVTNLIGFLKFELNRIIVEKGETDGVDEFFCEFSGNCDEEIITNQAASTGVKTSVDSSLTELQKKDTKANGYGLGSAKTLIGEYKGETVEIMDIGLGLETHLPNANGMSRWNMTDVIGMFPRLQTKYMKSLNRDHIYSVRQKTTNPDDKKHLESKRLVIGSVFSQHYPSGAITHGNITPRSTMVLSQIPGEVEESEFVGRCSLGFKGAGRGQTIGTSATLMLLTEDGRKEKYQNELKRYTSSSNIVMNFGTRRYESKKPEDVIWLKDEYLPKYLDAQYCTIPNNTEFYINIKPGDFPATCSDSEPCIITFMPPFHSVFDPYSQAINRELQRDYFDKFAGDQTLSDGIVPIQYNKGVRTVKGGYSESKTGECLVRDPYTNSCKCSSGFSPYDKNANSGYGGETGGTTYQCINSSTGPVAGECGSAHGIKTSRDITYGFCKNGYTNQTTLSWGKTQQGFTYSQALQADALNSQMGGGSTSDGTYAKIQWTCGGIPTQIAQQARCEAQYSGPRRGGVCGSSSGKEFSATPTSALCSVGKATNIELRGTAYGWACQGENFGSTKFCSAKKK